MSFQILEILDSHPQGILAKVSHQNNQLTVLIPNQEKKDLPVGMSFQAEIGFDRVLTWKSIDDFEDARSEIWQEPDGIHLLGRVHNILDYGDGKTIIDVYMQNGPEFFTVSSEMMEEVLEASAGLEITVGVLYVYPDER